MLQPSENSSGRIYSILNFLLSAACALLFVYTALSKIEDHQRFLKGISRIELIGPYAVLISIAVPVIEIITGLLIFIPWTNKIGLKSFLAIMVVFTVYIFIAITWASNLPCHCGGVVESLTWTEHIWFNLGFITLALTALWLDKKS